MIGLSYNDIDKRYIKEISLKQKIPWRFVCYGEDDFKMVKAYADDIGVNDYLIMTYNDICELYVDSENT